jgi:hypothetical protein
LKTGNLIPFLGPGISPNFYIDLALKLNQFAQRKLPSENRDNQSPNEKLIQTLVGIPCTVCTYWPEERPNVCPVLKSMDESVHEEGCSLFLEQQLAVSKINLRYICQYYMLKDGLEIFYDDLYEILEKLRPSYQPSSLHQFLAKLPHFMLAHNAPRRSPGLPFQLIVTTNYDDMLEQAFTKANQPFDVVFYIADGFEKGSFKHKPYGGEAQQIGRQDSERLPLPSYSGQARPIILKLFGTWQEALEDYFVTTEQQIAYLINILEQKLPTALLKTLKQNRILFMGFSPNDSDLQFLMNAIWKENRLHKKPCLFHQARLGQLERELWQHRNVDLLEMPPSVDDLVAQLWEAVEVRVASNT